MRVRGEDVVAPCGLMLAQSGVSESDDGPGQPGGTPHQFSSGGVDSMPALCSDLLREKKGGSDCRKIHLCKWESSSCENECCSVLSRKRWEGEAFRKIQAFGER